MALLQPALKRPAQLLHSNASAAAVAAAAAAAGGGASAPSSTSSFSSLTEASVPALAAEIRALVGVFDLDPNRALDLLLDALEGAPTPAAKITTRPFSRWRSARRRITGSHTLSISIADWTRVCTPSCSSAFCMASAFITVASIPM